MRTLLGTPDDPDDVTWSHHATDTPTGPATTATTARYSRVVQRLGDMPWLRAVDYVPLVLAS